VRKSILSSKKKCESASVNNLKKKLKMLEKHKSIFIKKDGEEAYRQRWLSCSMPCWLQAKKMNRSHQSQKNNEDEDGGDDDGSSGGGAAAIAT
jgi:hypothetical protein